MTDNKHQDTSKSGTGPRSAKSGRGLAGSALGVALAAAAGSGYVGYQWYTQQQAQTAKVEQLDARLDARLEQALSQVREQRDALIQGVKDRIQALQTEAQSLRNENQSLQNEDRSLKSEIQDLRDNLLAQRDTDQALRSDFQTLKGRIEIQQGALEMQKSDTQTLQSDIRNLQGNIQALQNETQALQGETQLVKNNLQDLRENTQSQQEQIQALQGGTDTLQANIQGVQEQLVQHAQAQEETIGRLDTRLENLQLAQRGLLNTLEAVKAVAARGGDVNALPLSEVEYLLRMADHKLELQQNVGGAIEALRIALQRLETVGENAFLAVERMIRENIATLRAVDVPNTAALAEQISAMAQRVDELPLRVEMQMAALKEKVALEPAGLQDTAADGEAPWWEPIARLSSTAWGELKDIVVVRHERMSGPPLMAVEEEYFLRQNLRLKLETMRLSLLSGEAASFHEANETARAWTETYFNTENDKVSDLLSKLEQLKTVQLNPYIPDISATIRAFRDVMERREPIRSVLSPAPADSGAATEEAQP